MKRQLAKYFEVHISIVFRPGKLNNSYWENRVKADHVLVSLPPKTPPPKRRLMDVSVVNIAERGEGGR